MPRIEINEAELLLAEFADALAGAEAVDGHLVREIVEVLGWGEEKVRRGIAKLIATGSWEHCKVSRKVLNGSIRRLDGYRPVVSGD